MSVRQTVGRRALIGLLLVLPMAFSPVARADQQAEPNYYSRPAGISLEQAADMVRRETGGRVLSASPVNKGGQRGYNIRVLVDEKRVKNYYVDSEGRVSSR
ncbi:MAG: hypothetical protein R3E82_12205 [Pseudomonadales bacterium]